MILPYCQVLIVYNGIPRSYTDSERQREEVGCEEEANRVEDRTR